MGLVRMTYTNTVLQSPFQLRYLARRHVVLFIAHAVCLQHSFLLKHVGLGIMQTEHIIDHKAWR